MYDIKTLEFNKVLTTISEYSKLEITKEKVLNLTPTKNKDIIKTNLAKAYEYTTILYRFGLVPLSSVNISDSIKKSSIGSVLSIDELLDIVHLSKIINDSIKFLKDITAEDFTSTHYYEEVQNLLDITHLEKEILTFVNLNKEINDNATTELKRIRKSIKNTEFNIRNKINELISKHKSHLSDTVYTIKNDKFCLPVKADSKNVIKGNIITYSSSRETAFIEPFSISTLQNELTNLQHDEIQEIHRILTALTNTVSKYQRELETNNKILLDLDFDFSIAQYSKLIEGNHVTINDYTELKNARHPLINKKDVVANNISIGKEYNTIIITGPNTGGKTITLKTLGLLSVMAQSGILLPVDEGSSIKIYDNVLVDIGDEQSIEQNLSTFSSHISKIKNIVKNATSNSLVLLDELGSGTDPKEGSSLAISIVNHFIDIGSTLMCTTHYSELKGYAFENEKILNASVEFDFDTLAPTYKLLLGVPGKSNALNICTKLGLSQDIIKNAKQIMISNSTDNDNVVETLEKKSKKLDNLIRLQKEIVDQLNEDKNKLVLEQQKIENNKEHLIKEAKKKAEEILKEAKDKSDEIVASLKELKEKNYQDHEVTEIVSKFNEKEEEVRTKQGNHPISVGDYVLVIPLNVEATVSKQKNGKWEVKIGNMTSYYKEADLEFVSSPKKEKKKFNNTVTSHVKKSHNTKLDLRGKRYEEAEDMIDKFIDSCVYSRLTQGRIVHGFGTGVMRELVQKKLKQSKHVKNFRYGEGGEGGNGATVVFFK